MLRRTLAALLLLSACDSGSTPGDGGSDGETALEVAFAEPMGDAIASSQPVPIRVVTSVPVDRVDLLLDGVLTANLGAPPHEWSLPTATMSVGTHALVARATLGDTVVESAPKVLVIDRTPPGIIDDADIGTLRSDALWPERTQVRITFDEPLHPSSASTLSVVASQTVDDVVVPFLATLRIEGNVAVLTPHEPWPPSTYVTVTVSGKAIDLAGNETTVSATRAFSVPTYWERVSGQFAEYAVDGDLAADGDYFTLHASSGGSYLEGVGFVDDEEVEYTRSDAMNNAPDSFARITDEGTIYLAYRLTGTDPSVRVNRREAGGEFEGVQVLRSGASIGTRMHVAANGHAFVRTRITSSSIVTHHRAPEAASFTATSVYDDLPFWDGDVAFPGPDGRACALTVASDGAPTETLTHTVRCRGGGGPVSDVPVGGPRTGPLAQPSTLHANDAGNAVILVDRDVYIFDGATERVSLAMTLPPSDHRRVGIGSDGALCLLYGTHDTPEHGTYATHALKRSAAGGFEDAVIVHEQGYTTFEHFDPGFQLGVDAAGHCFVVTTMHAVHDATADGTWAPPFFMGPVQKLVTGPANAALVVGYESVFRFTPID